MIVPPTAPPVTDVLPIAIRAYAAPSWREFSDPDAPKAKRRRNSPLQASPWALVFDTETTGDTCQALRFGTYQLRHAGELVEAGIFYEPEGVDAAELVLLRSVADAQGLSLRTRDDFADEVFFARAYQLRATIIGFNLPFDISRLAIKHGSTHTPLSDDTNAMRGGFTFKLSRQKIYPNIRVKHMSRKAALISFAAPMGQPDGRGQRSRGFKSGVRRGHFIDVKTLANALLARSFSLATLSKFLGMPSPKLRFENFDGPITAEMVHYAVRDVQATWECYAELIARFDALNLNQTIPEKIYSEAGIGKAYILEMGIEPWRKVQPDVPPDLIARIMGSYFGGRSEVRIRREVRQVILCDFLSMYPTVCTLMGLWRFVIADGMAWRDTTNETRALLDKIDLKALQAKETWKQLSTLVRVRPDADIFPVRASYSGEAQSTIGANFLSSETPLWFTLADCIASKLLTGKAAEIVEALSFVPGPVQDGLRPIDIAGNPECRVDPMTSDFFKRVIELRQSIKRRMAGASGDERMRLDTEQNALKICANSTSYGIWVEVNVETRPARKSVTVHNSTCDQFSFATDKAEMPGKYFHPLLATLITGAARLMLAIAERLATDQDLEWAFCDTDSMAFAKPDHMNGDEFAAHTNVIVDWFAALNPYNFQGSILKIEDVNSSLDGGKPEPLYCFAISSKRYALFNLASDNGPIMRKVSAHGLGHLLQPYNDDKAPPNFPTPDKSVLKDGTLRWHCDLWRQIVSATLAGYPDQARRDYHPALGQPAISRYAATSPDMLRWFKTYNANRRYRDQVKPFGFLLAMSEVWDVGGESIISSASRGRRKKSKGLKPIAPFETDHGKAVQLAFDRETGSSVPASSLRTYADALAQYHISPESKFLNGDFSERGTTQRRHIRMASALHIGKEANDWERQAIIGMIDSSEISYGVSADSLAQQLQAFIAQYGEAQAAKALKVSKGRLTALASDASIAGVGGLANSIAARLPKAISLCGSLNSERQRELAELRAAVARDGLRETARRLDIDPSNLRRRLRATERRGD
jgi:hypothetical protein